MSKVIRGAVLACVLVGMAACGGGSSDDSNDHVITGVYLQQDGGSLLASGSAIDLGASSDGAYANYANRGDFDSHTAELALVNYSGRTLTLTSSDPSRIDPVSAELLNCEYWTGDCSPSTFTGAAAETGMPEFEHNAITPASLPDGAIATFEVTFTGVDRYAVLRKRYVIPLQDADTGEAEDFVFEVYGVTTC